MDMTYLSELLTSDTESRLGVAGVEGGVGEGDGPGDHPNFGILITWLSCDSADT